MAVAGADDEKATAAMFAVWAADEGEVTVVVVGVEVRGELAAARAAFAAREGREPRGNVEEDDGRARLDLAVAFGGRAVAAQRARKTVRAREGMNEDEVTEMVREDLGVMLE